MYKQEGFTLIELIVVIAIIAILAAIVMVNVVQYIQKSQNAAVLSDLQQIPSVATDYYVNHGNYGFGDDVNQDFYWDSQVQTVENAICKMNSSFTYTFQDEEIGSQCYHGGNRGGIGGSSNCVGKWVIYVTNGDNLIACIDSSGYVGSDNTLTPSTNTDCACK